MRGLLKNKKGDITDVLIFLISIFILGIGLFVMTFVIPSVADGLRTGGLNNSAEGIDAINELESFGSIAIQRGFLFIFIGLIISSIISSFLTRVHPAFLFLYIFVFGITVFLGTYLGNAYQSLSENPIFAAQLASQTLINVVFDNIVTILVAVGTLTLIVVFSKFSSRPGSGGGAGGPL